MTGEVRLQNRGKVPTFFTASRSRNERSQLEPEKVRETLGLGKKVIKTVKRLSTGLRLATIVLTAVVLYASFLKRSGKTLFVLIVPALTLLALNAAVSQAKTHAQPPAAQKQIFTRGTIVANAGAPPGKLMTFFNLLFLYNCI